MRKYIVGMFIALFCFSGTAYAWQIETGPFNEIKSLESTKMYATYGRTFAGGMGSQNGGIVSYATSLFHITHQGKDMFHLFSFGGSLAANVAGEGNTGNLQGDAVVGITFLDTVTAGLKYNPERSGSAFDEAAGFFLGARFEY